jgi:predicted transcriptional regulator
MKLELTDKEQKLLLELVEGEQNQIIQELDHADSRDYKAILRERLRTLEGLLTKVQSRAA